MSKPQGSGAPPWLLPVGLFGGIGALLWLATNDFGLPPALGGKREPDAQLDTYSFLGEYRANDVTADVKYRGKHVRLTGAVGGQPQREGAVYLPASTTFDGRGVSVLEVRCELTGGEEKAIVDFVPGSRVTMFGKVGAFEKALLNAYAPLEGCRFEVTQKADAEQKQWMYGQDGNPVEVPMARVVDALGSGRFGFAPKQQVILPEARGRLMVIQAEQIREFFGAGR